MFKLFSIVLFNNRLEEVIEFLNCLKGVNQCHIIFINNGRPDSSIESFLGKIVNCTFLQSSHNKGFGSGHNSLLEEERHNYPLNSILFICNLDTRFNFKDINDIENYFLKYPEVVGLNPKVLNMDNSRQKIHHLQPRALSQFIYKFLGSSKFKLKYESKYINQYIANKENHVEILSGCFLVCRYESFKILNGFNSKYFLYFEDWDLSKRLSSLGDLVVLNDVYVKHAHKSEANFKLKPFIHFVNSYFKFHFSWNRTKR